LTIRITLSHPKLAEIIAGPSTIALSGRLTSAILATSFFLLNTHDFLQKS